VNRLPIRVRLTLAFGLAVVVVLAGACGFVYVQLRADADDSIAGELEARMTAAQSLLARGDELGTTDSGLIGERDDSMAQLLTPDGRAVVALGAVRTPALDGADLRRASRGRVTVERRLPGFDDAARMLAEPARDHGAPRIIVVGESLVDRNEALRALVRSFAIAGFLGVLIASAIGSGLTSAGLGPVENMRRRASEISMTGESERLPLGPARDEIRRLGETLNAMLDRLRRSFERERRFVGDASHELRSPIAVIKTELEGVLRTDGLGPNEREAIAAAAAECDRLAQLAEDLLVLARAADGHLPVRPEPLGILALLEGTRDRFTDRAAERGRTILVDAPAELCVMGDPLRLRQALGNLVDNAVRHGEGDIALSARPTAGGVAIDVSDQGAGFDADIAERAFERFTRASESRSGEGAGLGLAIVRAIADAHGGRAEIVETPSGGTVRLVLPAVETHGPAPLAPPTLEGSPSHVPLI
jgi:two-component system OmpR family sensor kinase